jgi:hypothetical protein
MIVREDLNAFTLNASIRSYVFTNIAVRLSKQSISTVGIFPEFKSVARERTGRKISETFCPNTGRPLGLTYSRQLPQYWACPCCRHIRVHCGNVEIKFPWLSACGCFYFPSSSRESKLKIPRSVIHDGMKGLIALLHVPCVEPRSEERMTTSHSVVSAVTPRVRYTAVFENMRLVKVKVKPTL